MINEKNLLALAMIILGFKVLFVKQFWGRGAFHDFSNPLLYIPISGFLIIGGGMLLFSKKRKKLKNNFHFVKPKTKKEPKKPKGEKVKFDKPKNKFSLKNIKFKSKNRGNIDEIS
ncbi:MAG: LPXTG cell wall anchor domain-containing protein [Campylobacter sp.]|nr:LPXTG cell wall anchor domain-containing protein [Campylobacter sp.]